MTSPGNEAQVRMVAPRHGDIPAPLKWASPIAAAVFAAAGLSNYLVEVG